MFRFPVHKQSPDANSSVQARVFARILKISVQNRIHKISACTDLATQLLKSLYQPQLISYCVKKGFSLLQPFLRRFVIKKGYGN